MGAVSHVFTNAIADGADPTVVRPSDWNSAHSLAQTLSGNTSGQSTWAGTNLVFQGGNNITLSLTNDTVIFSGPNTSPQTAFQFSNSNGVSFGTNGSTVTASVNTNYQAPGAYLTTAMQSDAATISNIKLSAGANSALLSQVTFSNSNGVSFGLNGSTITASVATNYQSQGNYLTTAMQSDAATISNIKVSAGANSALLSQVTFSNSNGVSFGLNGSTITASVATNYQSQGAYLTTARASTDAVGLNTAQTRVTWTVNSSGISIDAGGYNGTGFTTTTAGGAVIAGTNDTSGLKLGVPSFLTTAMLSNAVTLSNIKVSAGTQSSNLSALTFADSNGLSWGLSNGVITGTVAAAGGGLTNINVSAGTTSNNLSNVTFADSNGVSFGLNGSTLTASVAGAAGATLNRFIAPDHGYFSVGSAGVHGSVSIQSALVPVAFSATALMIGASISVGSAANNSSAYINDNFILGVYTRNGQTLGSVSSTNVNFTTSWTSNATGSVQGNRFFALPWNITLTQGNYYFAINNSTNNSATGGANSTALGHSCSFMIGISNNNAMPAPFGVVGNPTSSAGFIMGAGIYTATTLAFLTQIQFSDISQFGATWSRANLVIDFQG